MTGAAVDGDTSDMAEVDGKDMALEAEVERKRGRCFFCLVCQNKTAMHRLWQLLHGRRPEMRRPRVGRKTTIQISAKAVMGLELLICLGHEDDGLCMQVGDMAPPISCRLQVGDMPQLSLRRLQIVS